MGFLTDAYSFSFDASTGQPIPPEDDRNKWNTRLAWHGAVATSVVSFSIHPLRVANRLGRTVLWTTAADESHGMVLLESARVVNFGCVVLHIGLWVRAAIEVVDVLHSEYGSGAFPVESTRALVRGATTVLGASRGADFGAALGSRVAPGIGTAIGTFVGAFAGSLLYRGLTDAIIDQLFKLRR